MRCVLIQKCLAGTLALWLGLLQCPLPFAVRAPAQSKDQSVPYPCMNRPCGCASAEQCWRSCCCTTKSERIAWAKEHLGYIPAALASASDHGATEHESSKAVATSKCDHGHCDSPESKACCREKTSHSDPEGESDVVASDEPQSRSVVFSEMMKCRGLSAVWSIFSLALPVVPPSPSPTIPRRIESVTIQDSLAYLSRTLQPPSRPPQTASI